MNIWLHLPFLPVPQLRELVLFAESLGIEGVAVSEHVCLPVQIDSEYPYLPGQPARLPLETEFPDPLTLIASLGSITTRLRFMTNVLIVPLRHPVLLAKEVATTATVIGGRLDLGVGVGWMREEFDAIGVPFAARGSRTDETLRLLRQLWVGDPVECQGEHFTFGPIAVHPTPPAPVALFVGGHSDAAIRRAAQLGDGWVGVNPTFAELEYHLAKLHEARRDAGRDHSAFEIRTGVKGSLDADLVHALEELGVASLVLMPWQLSGSGGSGSDGVVAAMARRLSTLVDQIGPASVKN